MSVLSIERDEIAAALVGDLTTFTYVPDRLVPPAAIVTAGGPYIERREGDPFGTLSARFEVWLVQGTATNEVATRALDEAIEANTEALFTAGFAVESVSEPFTYAIQQAQYLTVILTVISGVNFK